MLPHNLCILCHDRPRRSAHRACLYCEICRTVQSRAINRRHMKGYYQNNKHRWFVPQRPCKQCGSLLPKGSRRIFCDTCGGERAKAANLARNAEWRIANNARKREQQKRYREANPLKVRSGKKRYYQSTAWYQAQTQASARMHKLELSRAELTREEWLSVSELITRARYLGMHLDHVVPLSPCRVCAAVGTWHPDNLQLLLPKDNLAKSNRCQTCWVDATT